MPIQRLGQDQIENNSDNITFQGTVQSGDYIGDYEGGPWGYTVTISEMGDDPSGFGGAPVEEYWAGNSRFDSAAFTSDPSQAVPVDELEQYAKQTAQEMVDDLAN